MYACKGGFAYWQGLQTLELVYIVIGILSHMASGIPYTMAFLSHMASGNAYASILIEGTAAGCTYSHMALGTPEILSTQWPRVSPII